MAIELVEEAIFDYLTSGGEVLAIVGTRIYAIGEVPERVTYPYISYRVPEVNDEEMVTFNSVGDTPDKSTFRFFCTAVDSLEAKRLAKALKKRLNGIRETIDNVQIQGIRRMRQVDYYDEETKTQQVIADYEVPASYL